MSNTLYSPYQCAKVVNAQLQDLGIEKKLPPQMFYTYVNKGYITSTKINDKVKVTHEDLVKWFTKYVSKIQGTSNNENNVDENQLVLDI